MSHVEGIPRYCIKNIKTGICVKQIPNNYRVNQFGQVMQLIIDTDYDYIKKECNTENIVSQLMDYDIIYYGWKVRDDLVQVIIEN